MSRLIYNLHGPSERLQSHQKHDDQLGNELCKDFLYSALHVNLPREFVEQRIWPGLVGPNNVTSCHT